MSNDMLNFLTPVGRLVQGNPFIPNKTDMQGAPLVIKTGPNAGQPRVDFFIAVAIPKTDPGINELYGKMVQAGMQGFPQLFPGGQCIRPDFSFKMIDGDGYDGQGQPYANREGFRGNWVFKFSSSFPPKVMSANGAATLTDHASVKKGYYVRVYGNVAPNNNAQKPGIYLNYQLLEMVAYGPEIISGPDGAMIFGKAPAVLPPGASATPLAPPVAAAPGYGPPPTHYAPPPATPAPAVYPGAPAAPAYVPPAAPAYVPPAAPAYVPPAAPAYVPPAAPAYVPPAAPLPGTPHPAILNPGALPINPATGRPYGQ